MHYCTAAAEPRPSVFWCRAIIDPDPYFPYIPKSQERAGTALIATDPAGTRSADGVGQRAVGAAGVGEGRAGEVRDAEHRAAEVRSGEVRVPEVRSGEVHTLEVSMAWASRLPGV